MPARWLLLLVAGHSRVPTPVLSSAEPSQVEAESGEGGEGGVLDCWSEGSEDWPSVQRRLFRLLAGEAAGDALSRELARAAAPAAHSLAGDCAPGRISLRALLLLTTPSMGLADAADFLEPAWRLLGVLGWAAVVRTGWPVFRLLRLLQLHCKPIGEDRADTLVVPGCGDNGEPFAALLRRHVQRHQVRAGESLLASSAVYLLEHSEASGWCPLSAAAAYLAIAWLRYPVYDLETEDLLQLAEPLVSSLDLGQLLATRHALVDMASDVAGAYQSFLIDSGALYKDLRPKEVVANTVDYTRHMMSGPAAGDGAGGICPVASMRTPLGRCNAFAPLGPGLAPWRRRGVALEDTLRAFRGAANVPTLLLRVMGGRLEVLLPSASPKSEEAAACLASLLRALSERSRLPGVDVAANLGGRPLLRRPAGHSARHAAQGRREDVPAPLFSTCAREGYWDIPLPRLCGVQCAPADFILGVGADEAGEDEPTLCYMFRLLVSYAELLRYTPSQGQVPLSYFESLRSWRLAPPPPREESDAFAVRCAELIERSAQ